MNISVIGAGGWGTTLAILLAARKEDVTLWTERREYFDEMLTRHGNPTFLPGVRLPDSIRITTDLEEAAARREMVVLAVPSQFLRSVLERISPRLLGEAVLVNVAKGIEQTTLMTMSEVLRDVFPGLRPTRIVTLSGPSHAEEVSRGIPTAVVAACTELDTARGVQRTFGTRAFRVYVSGDIRGVELGGALKNVIAVGAGISDGVGFGDNTKAAIMTRGMAEIIRLGVALGARQETFSGLSGMGDLIVTCMSRHSRNRYVGEEVGKGRTLGDVLSSMKMVAEGVETTRSAVELARRLSVELPIAAQVYKVLFEGKNPNDATADLMSRDMKEEV